MHQIHRPSVSIVIPLYNRAEYIAEAVQSALHQTVPVLEVLVIDDGSTDDSATIVQSIKHEHLRYIEKEHGGLADTRNHGIELAQGDYILWLDSDDILMPNTHEHYINCLRLHPDIDIFYGMLLETDQYGNPQIQHSYEDFYEKNSSLLNKLLVKNRIPQPGTMVRKSLYQKHGGYNTDFKRAPDYEFWARVVLDAQFKHTKALVCKWRVHANNMSCIANYADFSPEIAITKRLLNEHHLESLFPHLDWTDKAASLVSAYFEIGNNFYNKKAYDDALKYYQKASTCASKIDYQCAEQRAALQISIGNIHFNKKEYVQAQNYYQRSTDIFLSYRSYYKLAVIADQLGEMEKAIRYYKLTLNANPKHKAAQHKLSQLLSLSGNSSHDLS